MRGKPITLYDDGRLRRDFTYIDDIVAGVVGCLDRPPDGTPPIRLLNIGNNGNEAVSTLVELLEAGLGRRAVLRHAPRPLADVAETRAVRRCDRRAHRLRAEHPAFRGNSAVYHLVPVVDRIEWGGPRRRGLTRGTDSPKSRLAA